MNGVSPPANKGREGEVMGREGGNSGVDLSFVTE